MVSKAKNGILLSIALFVDMVKLQVANEIFIANKLEKERLFIVSVFLYSSVEY